MALPRIFVIDDSEAVRETLAIVLGSSCDVHELPPHECSASFPVPDGKPDLLIVNADAAPALLLRAVAASGHPAIWLRARPELGAPIPEAAGRSVVMPLHFDGHALAEQVRELLRHAPSATSRVPTRQLTYPFVPEDAARIAGEATANRLPVLICGEPGTGRARVAAAIHANSATGRFVAVSPRTCTRSTFHELAAGGNDLTVLVDEVASTSDDAQALLLEIVEAGGLSTPRGWLGVRLITASGVELASSTYAGNFSRDLYYRLSVLPITLTPLRDRPQDIPLLARAIAAELCSTLACGPVSFTPRAMQRLSRYLWFGNTAELETVLARTISLVRKEVIDVGDLLFGFGPLPHPQAQPSRPERPGPRLATSAVDLIINELAHEFKNPLVTLKTFAQHLDRLLEEESSRDQLVLLTGDAVDRMDRALENLLQFTRFHEPSPQQVPLGALLGPALADLGGLLSERRLMLDYRPPDSATTVHVDPVQLEYAIDNLLRAVVRTVSDGGSISVAGSESGTVTVRVPTTGGKGVDQLASLLSARDPNEESPLPLGLALARSVIKRNGGDLELEETEAGATVTVRLPGEAERRRVQRDDGTTTTADR